jgi:Xaa-Pro aminopeptidase
MLRTLLLSKYHRIAPDFVMCTEQKHRQIRFFRELVRVATDVHRRIGKRQTTSGLQRHQPLEPAHYFPGAAALIFQSEHTHRTHDIPSLDYRGDTAFEYFVGTTASSSAPSSAPLFPLGLQPRGPHKCAPGGMATCVLFSVKAAQEDSNMLKESTERGVRFHATVDVFIPHPCSSPEAPLGIADAEHALWHHDGRGDEAMTTDGLPERVTLLDLNDTIFTMRTHDHAVSRVAGRIWDVLGPPLGACDGREGSPVWTAERFTSLYDIPYFMLSCPSTRSCTSHSIAPASLHSIVDDVCRRSDAAVGEATLRLDADELDALKRAQCSHPVSGVLSALLLLRRFVIAPQSHQPSSSSSEQTSLDGAVFQYSIAADVAQSWGVPQKWAHSAQSYMSSASMQGSTSSATAPFVQVAEASPSGSQPNAVVGGRGMGQRVFARSRTVLPASTIIDKLRACKSPYDAAMFLRCAFITLSAFVEGMRCGGQQQELQQRCENAPVLDFCESDILQAMIRGGWSGARNMRHHTQAPGCAMQNSVFGYPPVVAAGRNALAVHYTAAASVVGSDDWVLVDAGAEIDGMYTTDCTRCWPAGRDAARCLSADVQPAGSPALRAYRATLEAQMEILQAIRPAMTKRELRDVSKKILLSHMIHLLSWSAVTHCDGHLQSLAAYVDRAYEAFALHSVGHFTGFDIHESGPPTSALDAGTMHTVEPGIYIRSPDDALFSSLMAVFPAIESVSAYRSFVPEELGGIGMRVEDSILVLPLVGALSATGHTRDDYLSALVAEYCSWTGPDSSRELSPRTSLNIAEARARFVAWQRSSMFAVGTEVPGCVVDHWYPFYIVVMTAAIPKSVEALQDVIGDS